MLTFILLLEEMETDRPYDTVCSVQVKSITHDTLEHIESCAMCGKVDDCDFVKGDPIDFYVCQECAKEIIQVFFRNWEQ